MIDAFLYEYIMLGRILTRIGKMSILSKFFVVHLYNYIEGIHFEQKSSAVFIIQKGFSEGSSARNNTVNKGTIPLEDVQC